MSIEEGIFWDEHWVLYGNQFDNKFHILKKLKKKSLWYDPRAWSRVDMHEPFTLRDEVTSVSQGREARGLQPLQ